MLYDVIINEYSHIDIAIDIIMAMYQITSKTQLVTYRKATKKPSSLHYIQCEKQYVIHNYILYLIS